MNPVRRMRLGLSILAGILVVGTIGYVILENAGWLDSFYMVVITITTVGFAEVFELSEAGRLWTMVVIFSGFGIAFYTALAVLEYLVDIGESRRRNRMLKTIDGVSDHVIICGYGRVGRAATRALKATDTVVVVVEILEDRAERAWENGDLVVMGDATHNEVLVQAGIERASALIACVNLDSDNLVIALSAKAMKRDLRVITRANESQTERKHLLAGADAVVTPVAVGAERLAALAVQPELAQIFDVVVGGRPVEFHVEEVDVQPGCEVAGRTIKDSRIRELSGAMVLAVEDQKVTMQVNPGPDVVLKAGDRLVLVGSKDQVEKAALMLAS